MSLLVTADMIGVGLKPNVAHCVAHDHARFSAS